MTNLTPTAGWDDVPQLETNTIALGGPGGPMNGQAQALLNRTEELFNSTEELRNASLVVNTVLDLSLINNPKNGQRVYVLRYGIGNLTGQGAGYFVFDSSKVNENDFVGVINGWVREVDFTAVDPFMAGAVAITSTTWADNNLALERARLYARSLRQSLLINGWFATSKPIVQESGDVMIGYGFDQSRIYKTTNDGLSLESRAAPERVGVTDDYNVDACLIWYPPNNGYATNIQCTDIFFQAGSWNDGKSVQYGLYAPRHAQCTTNRLQFDNVKVAFLARNLFSNKHTNFRSIGSQIDYINQGETGVLIYDGEGIMTGTSNTFERFMFVNFQNGYNITNLQTSEFTKCYGEAISKNDSASESFVFFINNPFSLRLTNCGQEVTKATAIYVNSYGEPSGMPRTLIIDGYQALWGIGGTQTDLGLNLVTLTGPMVVDMRGSALVKNDTGILNNFVFIANGAKLINHSSVIGTGAVGDVSNYYDATSALTRSGMTEATVSVGNDLDNGIEWKPGVVHKLVQGASLNVPAGMTDCWGTSTYYGLNSSQGVQVLHLTNSATIWKRTVIGTGNHGEWVAA